MSRVFTLAILSDVHYASAAEQARGEDYAFQGIRNPLVRHAVKALRQFMWLRHPLRQNYLLDRFLEATGPVDGAIANGDYCCDTAFLGVSDEAACQSVRECLARLRGRFGDKLHVNLGDHDLGKLGFAGGCGGMRLASYHRAQHELGLVPFWRIVLGRYVSLGLVSSLVALPVFEPDTLPEERAGWASLREAHMADIRAAFAALAPEQRVLLFCHDPTALPFLWREEAVRRRLPQLEQTIIGHLHSNLILWKSRALAGLPVVRALGHSGRRMSTALHEARHWKPFHVRLCPALAGIELLKDGGFLTAELDADAGRPARFRVHRLPR
jgi:hypothetical protein